MGIMMPSPVRVRDALIAFMVVTAQAQAQAEAIKAAQKAGIEAAKKDETKYRGGKPSYDRVTLNMVRNMLARKAGTLEIARETGLSRQAVLRIKADPAAVEAALVKCGM